MACAHVFIVGGAFELVNVVDAAQGSRDFGIVGRHGA